MHHLFNTYEQVIEHFRSCEIDSDFINDIWEHKLDTKGRRYSMDQLVNALAPGSLVSGDFYVFNVHLDPTSIDKSDQVLTKILEAGQSEFGNPVKDINLFGNRYSSKFIASALIASRIIHRLDAIGIKSPKIMEIGSGIAVLIQTLKLYYGEDVTLFAVDIPETLAIQEWLLKNWFPAAKTTFKSSSRHVDMAEGGINLVNSYALASQDIEVDVVINTSSFQEIEASIVDGYFDYAAKNLSPDGFFYYENHFGHGSTCAIGPSEHQLAENFTTLETGFVSRLEMLSPYEAFRLILGKSNKAEDPKTRRFIHRVLWNGYNLDIFFHTDGLAKRLATLPESTSVNNSVSEVTHISRQHGVEWGSSDLEHLASSPVLKLDQFLVNTPNRADNAVNDLSPIDAYTATLRQAQTKLINLMRDAGSEPIIDQATVKSSVKSLCQHLASSVKDAAGSEIISSSLACFVMPLGHTELGREALTSCLEQSSQPYWLLRFAHLLSNYGYKDEAIQALKRFDPIADLTPTYVSKAAEIFSFCGEDSQALQIVNSLSQQRPNLNYMELLALAKASVVLGQLDAASQAFNSLVNLPEGQLRLDTYEFLQWGLDSFPGTEQNLFTSQQIELLDTWPDGTRQALLSKIIHHTLCDSSSNARHIDQQIWAMDHNYHSMGWAGQVLMRAGLVDVADQCLSESIKVAPETFLHREFVASVYFYASYWEKAANNFDAALSLVPYVKPVQARLQFCLLPETLKQDQVFATAPELELIYQQNEDFYSNITPTAKAIFRFIKR